MPGQPMESEKLNRHPRFHPVVLQQQRERMMTSPL
ncbi:hypothetical protein OIU76_019230 [Salix suchowensis]|nr:hypothetical protein OIU76_019230 [Salix suchowensis]